MPKNSKPRNTGPKYSSLKITPEAAQSLREFSARLGATLDPPRTVTLSEAVLEATKRAQEQIQDRTESGR